MGAIGRSSRAQQKENAGECRRIAAQSLTHLRAALH
jgi:hypothetical protein